jgi:hypothetical protein
METRWGGTDDRGRKVGNGVYFAEIVVNGSADTTGRSGRKLIKIAVLRRKG